MNFNEREQKLLLKIKRFCAYRERSRKEVVDKLRKLGTSDQVLEKMLSFLAESDYINELRFAKLFVSGKFRIKRWGKVKIKAELQKKGVPFNLINQALDEIEQEEYMKTLIYLAEKKRKEIKNEQYRMQKVGMFLLSKGFEPQLIRKVLKTI